MSSNHQTHSQPSRSTIPANPILGQTTYTHPHVPHPDNTSYTDCRSSHKNPTGNTPLDRLLCQYTSHFRPNSTPGSVKTRESIDISGILSIQTAPKRCHFFKSEKGMYLSANFRDFLQFFGAVFQQLALVESHSTNCSGARIQMQVLSISPL